MCSCPYADPRIHTAAFKAELFSSPVMKTTLKKSPQSQLLYRVNPLAAGMTECERGRCRTKSRLAGWTHILGTDAQNMSQWTGDQRRRAASDVGSRSPLSPPNSIFPPCRDLSFFPSAPLLSFWGLNASACVRACVCVSPVCIHLYLHTQSPFTLLCLCTHAFL